MQNGILPKEYFRTIITEFLPPLESDLQGFGIQL